MAIRLRLDKPWKPLTPEEATRLPGQLGVYQIADAKGTVLYIGRAGAPSAFGLRSELQREAKDKKATPYLPVMLMVSTVSSDMGSYQPEQIQKAAAFLVSRRAKLNAAIALVSSCANVTHDAMKMLFQ